MADYIVISEGTMGAQGATGATGLTGATGSVTAEVQALHDETLIARDTAVTMGNSAVAAASTAVTSSVNASASEVAAANSANAANLAAQNIGSLAYTTVALMNADLAHDVNTIALVTNDVTAANNGQWIKLGNSGTGSWQKSAYVPPLVDGAVTESKLRELSVSPNKTSFIRKLENLFNKTVTTSGIINNATGTIVANAKYVVSDYIPVTVGKTYKSTASGAWAYYDANQVYVSGGTANPFNNVIPVNVYFVRLTFALAVIDSSMFFADDLPSGYIAFGEYKIVSNDTAFTEMMTELVPLIEPNKTTFVEEHIFNLFDLTAVTSGIMGTLNGNITANASYSVSDYIPVVVGDTYKTSYCYDGSYFTSTKAWLSGLPAATARASIAPPVNAAYIRLTYKNTDLASAMISKDSLPLTYKAYGVTKFKFSKPQYEDDIVKALIVNENFTATAKSKWYNKAAIAFGDSITWQDGRPYGGVGNNAIGYQSIIKQNLGLASYANYGVSGAPMSNGTSAGDGTNTTGKAIADYTVYNIVTIAAGINDYRLSAPLGVIGNIGNTTFDNTTFYGAYRELLEYILANNPTVRICLFTPLQSDNGMYDVNNANSAGYKLIDYVNAVTAVGAMYSIPVLDMYRNSGITKLTMATYLLDGLHPNDLGYERMGNYASDFINVI